MNKRYAFYAFFLTYIPKRNLVTHQGCIKSCIRQKHTLSETPSATRGSFCGVFRKDTLCQLKNMLNICYNVIVRKVRDVI